MNNKKCLKRLGIIGGGQLGKMLCQAASELSVETTTIDADDTAPAKWVSSQFLQSSFANKDIYLALAENSDVITYEREDIEDRYLNLMVESGATVHPHPNVLAIIRDKLKQKQFLKDNHIPTSHFEACETANLDQFQTFGYPLVQKARVGGFDGRGVQVIHSSADFEKALPVPSLIEVCVSIQTECAMMVARSETGSVEVYPLVEMNMCPEKNILDTLIVPARVSSQYEIEAKKIAEKLISELHLVGVLAIEFFITTSGELLVNEVSSRPHNSGHYTIEACITSQYQQHLRAILGYPLGNTQLLSPAVMINLLGEGDAGAAKITGLEDILAIPGVTVHIYGKKTSSPGRKMGHVVILDSSLDKALEKADKVKQLLSIKGGKCE